MQTSVFSVLIWFFIISIGQAQFQGGYEHDGKTVYCWETTTERGVNGLNRNDIIKQDTGSDCSIQLDFQISKNKVKVFEKISSTWTATLNGSVPAVTSVQGNSARAQIVHSNLHSCQFGSNCDPYDEGINGASPTANQYANFSQNSAIFTSDDVLFARPGIYSIVAHIFLKPNDTLRYDFAVYQQVVVTDGDAALGVGILHDSVTTYCWQINENYQVKTPTITSIITSGYGEDCPVQISILAPRIIATKTSFVVEWTCTLTPSDTAFFDIPFPLEMAQVNGKQVQVVHSNIHGCRFGTGCSPFAKGENAVTPSVSQTGTFSATNTITFSSDEIALKDIENYTLLAHIVLPLPDNTRADFVTHFRALAVQNIVVPSAFTEDGVTTYCWKSAENPEVTEVNAAYIKASGQDMDCPATMSIDFSSRNVEALEKVEVTWTVKQNPVNGPNAIVDIAELGSKKDLVSNRNVQIWHSNIHGCVSDTNCSPFFEGEQPMSPSVNEVQNFNPSGEATFGLSDLQFSNTGEYTIFAHIILVLSEDANTRIDLVTYQRVVVGGLSGTSIVVIVVILSVVLLALVLSVVAWKIHRRRKERNEEMLRAALAHTPSTPPPTNTFETTSWKKYAAISDTVSGGPSSQLYSIDGQLVEMDANAGSYPSASKTSSHSKDNGDWKYTPAVGHRQSTLKSSVPITTLPDDEEHWKQRRPTSSTSSWRGEKEDPPTYSASTGHADIQSFHVSPATSQFEDPIEDSIEYSF